MKISWTALLPILASRKLEQDDFSSNRHPALSFCLSMIFRANASRLSRGKTGTHPRIKSEGKLFRIMLQATL
jgi:hypothetical protein